jgi:SAM-dependent methyltransferase
LFLTPAARGGIVIGRVGAAEKAVWLYAVTIFLSAFLLFQVQPLIGKWILPWFGGGPAVWTTCMLFFQTVLLAGYAYAHLVRTRLGERGQGLVHVGLLVAAALLLPVGPSAGWKPVEAGDPTWRILAVLAIGAGLPYFALSATSPLLQAWFSTAHPGRSPYRLYALSNVGSLLALASYPFVIEPLLRLRVQSWAWSAGFVAFGVLCGACAVRAWRVRPAADPAASPDLGGAGGGATGGCAGGGGATGGCAGGGCAAGGDCGAIAADACLSAAAAAARPAAGTRLLWLALAACGSVMLLAVTNEMCLQVGVVPFLWVLPLGMYLLSFILCFESERIYWRPVFWPLLMAAAGGMIWLLFENVDAPIFWQIVGYGGGLFVCCMVCHGELARLKPHPRYLTSFYLTASAGGALGGVLVTLVAPLVFPAYFELHVGLWACFALAIVAFWHERSLRPGRRRRWVVPVFALGGAAVLAGVVVGLSLAIRQELEDAVSTTRNFYGVLQVIEYDGDNPDLTSHVLLHGRIMHGRQYEAEPLRRLPSTYYGVNSGVGLTVMNRRPGGPLKVGVVGLGAGTLAAYGHTGDTYRFYEINPAVRRLATSRFTYLGDSAARCEVVLGDARLSMEREPPQAYDVLALDAFSGDSIPVHLLTAEAFEVYRRHLKPDGVLAVHISNRFLDLQPVVLALAGRFGMAAAVIDDETEYDEENCAELSSSTWVLVTGDKYFLQHEVILNATAPPEKDPPAPRLWTDDYSDLFGILR